MGYDVLRFVNLSPEIAENFKCSICLDIFEAPLELPCGHIFCLECIRGCFHSSTICECPECRRRVESQEVKPPNRKLLCLLHSFNIKCEFADEGCYIVVKVEDLIAHTRECPFNTSPRPSAPTEMWSYGNHDSLTDLLGSESNVIERLERLQRLHNILTAFSHIMNDGEQSEVELNDRSSENELLLQSETLCGDNLLVLIRIVLFVFLTGASGAAIVIGTLKLHSCTKMQTLPRALMALGISLLPSVILEYIRRGFFQDKFCVGLKFIQSFAVASLIYLSIVVYSNLDHTIKVLNDTSTCDVLLFYFSFWFISALLALICIKIIFSIFNVIYENLRSTWSEWERSYVLLSFIYITLFSGVIISVSAMTMGSVYLYSCPAIPSLTTCLIIFGCLNCLCCLTMLLNQKFECLENPCFWMLVIGCIASFICLAVPVHNNFPWEFTSHPSLNNIDCNTTIYTSSFVIVCVNYVTIGSAILMFCIYGGVCACLFFE